MDLAHVGARARREPHRPDARLPVRDPGDAGTRRRLDRQHRVGRRVLRQPLARRVRHVEGRASSRSRATSRPRTASAASAATRSRPASSSTEKTQEALGGPMGDRLRRYSTSHLDRPARLSRGDRARGRVPRVRRRGVRDRRDPARRRRLHRALPDVRDRSRRRARPRRAQCSWKPRCRRSDRGGRRRRRTRRASGPASSRACVDQLARVREVGRRDVERAQRRDHAQVDVALQLVHVGDESLLHQQRDRLQRHRERALRRPLRDRTRSPSGARRCASRPRRSRSRSACCSTTPPSISI